jgi:hypothetical protein
MTKNNWTIKIPFSEHFSYSDMVVFANFPFSYTTVLNYNVAQSKLQVLLSAMTAKKICMWNITLYSDYSFTHFRVRLGNL